MCFERLPLVSMRYDLFSPHAWPTPKSTGEWHQGSPSIASPLVPSWFVWVSFLRVRYLPLPSGYVKIAMETHSFLWDNPLFLWPFSIAMLVYQRVPFKGKQFLQHLKIQLRSGRPFMISPRCPRELEPHPPGSSPRRTKERLTTKQIISFCWWYTH